MLGSDPTLRLFAGKRESRRRHSGAARSDEPGIHRAAGALAGLFYAVLELVGWDEPLRNPSLLYGQIDGEEETPTRNEVAAVCGHDAILSREKCDAFRKGSTHPTCWPIYHDLLHCRARDSHFRR